MPSGDVSRFGGAKGGRPKKVEPSVPAAPADPRRLTPPEPVDPRPTSLGGGINDSCQGGCGARAEHAVIIGSTPSVACTSCATKAIGNARKRGHEARMVPLSDPSVTKLIKRTHTADEAEIRRSIESHLESNRPGVLQGEGFGRKLPSDTGAEVGAPVPTGPRRVLHPPLLSGESRPETAERVVREQAIARRPNWSSQLDSYVADVQARGRMYDARPDLADNLAANKELNKKVWSDVISTSEKVGERGFVEGKPMPMKDLRGRSKFPTEVAARSRKASRPRPEKAIAPAKLSGRAKGRVKKSGVKTEGLSDEHIALVDKFINSKKQ